LALFERPAAASIKYGQMNIGVFSKLGSSGGSEHRCAEMCNGIARYTSHDATLLCEGELNPIIEKKIDPRVSIFKYVFKNDGFNVNRIYDVDCLLVVNSDSYSFTKLDYWAGKTDHHGIPVELGKLKQIVFLFNFVISPASNLLQLMDEVRDLRIICANKHFFDEIQRQERFEAIRHLPRITLDSPIDPSTITSQKLPSKIIRIGKHSKAHGYKFNKEHAELISRMNRKFGSRIHWDFLGVPSERQEDICRFPNVQIRNEYSVSVGEYLSGIDIFLFFISWERNEPWSRAVAEGMMAGCPILATNRSGNRDQVVHENNGYLCDSTDEFEKWLTYLVENPEKVLVLGRNSRLYAQRFTPERITQMFIDFIA
jgi:glycosyltransferase involved in cell wall biosynthesis